MEDPGAHNRPDQELLQEEISDLRTFCTRPVPIGDRVLCRIIRRKDGVRKLYPRYELYLEPTRDEETGLMSGSVFLMSATKRRRTGPSHYTITLTRGQRVGGREDIVGKVRSNFVGTAFVHRREGRTGPEEEECKTIRQELAAVIYEPNILGFKGPRKMTILKRRMLTGAEPTEYRPTTKSETLLGRFKTGDHDGSLILHNKSPQWSEETQSYVLNFHGRVMLASVKNFQVVHEHDLDYIIMQFGRVTDSAFTMDVQYPFSLLEAFGIALTSFDAKLACE
ncbi:C-terminal domain of brain tubby protein [Piptocephalis cylindrospora]|uniref:C-terminal domain of brain tubby protein n=1 Tax=Piptocephalis cylindrospora TaxID=1907219 RepID=A0A4P9Y068_9FUNG|nr:C-terminal domain of brain tubby protein [Piptocephalis cylindrospora]|eukprot:RKP11832.1 C-terminal domain of brain tubby protein [Piptocephalis cylindrospora]